MMDCKFISKKISKNTVTVDKYSKKIKRSGKISNKVKLLAKSIVKKTIGFKAIKKLAWWVKKNIAHEVGRGFYQSPLKTLKRKKGNCCCHTELFLQMCVAVGIHKTHKLGFVHVGKMGFGYRHYFAIIDNMCVDTDGSRSNPLFYGGGLSWGVYQISRYPILPYT